MKGLHSVIKLAGLSIFGLAASIALQASTVSVSSSATAGASIITPLSISNNGSASQGLEFGQIVAHGGGWVYITPAGVRTVYGVEVVPSSASNAATFLVNGQANNTFSIVLPADGTVTLTSGSNTMPVISFASNPSGSGTLDSTGNKSVSVGATLLVGANQTAGNYTATFPVTVTYN